jgi:hypothetical protein
LRRLLEKHSGIIFDYLKLAAPDLVDFLLCLAGIVNGARGNTAEQSSPQPPDKRGILYAVAE